MRKDRRVEVLFDEKDYQSLERAAHARRQSVGAVVREAVAKYVAGSSEGERDEAWEWILSQELGPVGSPEEIKEEILRDIDEGIAKSLEAD
jgi:predicted transcriptional regulator